MSDEEAAAVRAWAWAWAWSWVGDGLDSVARIAICCEDGDGRSFHWPLYLVLLGLLTPVSTNCFSNGEAVVAPLET